MSDPNTSSFPSVDLAPEGESPNEGFKLHMTIDRSNSVATSDFGSRVRGDSIADQDGRQRLIRETFKSALENASNPVKVSFQDLKLTVQVPTSKQEKACGMGDKKPF